VESPDHFRLHGTDENGNILVNCFLALGVTPTNIPPIERESDVTSAVTASLGKGHDLFRMLKSSPHRT
jgi:hypothetical protein